MRRLPGARYDSLPSTTMNPIDIVFRHLDTWRHLPAQPPKIRLGLLGLETTSEFVANLGWKIVAVLLHELVERIAMPIGEVAKQSVSKLEIALRDGVL